MRRMILVLAILSLTGCTAMKNMTEKPMGAFEYELGESYRAQLEAQKFDPTPAGDAPVTGLDAKSAKRAMEKYQSPESQDKGPSFTEVVQQLMNTKK